MIDDAYICRFEFNETNLVRPSWKWFVFVCMLRLSDASCAQVKLSEAQGDARDSASMGSSGFGLHEVTLLLNKLVYENAVQSAIEMLKESLFAE